MKGLYGHLSWRVLLDFFSRGSFFLLNVIIARALGVAEFGKFGYAVSIVQIFYVFTDLGTYLQMMKELGERRGRDETRWQHYFKIKLILMAATSAVFAALCFLLWRWDRPWILMLMLPWMLGNSILDFQQFVCNGLGRMDVARRQMAIQRGLLVAGVLLAVVLRPTLAGIASGAALGSAVGAVASTVYLLRASGQTFDWSVNWTEWKQIMAASLPNAVSGAFGMWYLRLAPIVLAYAWTARELGEFTAAFRVYEATYIIPTAIMSIGLPHLSAALVSGGGTLRAEARRLGKLMVSGGFLWTVFLAGAGPSVLRLLFGERYAGAGPSLRILGFAGGLVFLNYFVTHLMIVLGRQRRHALNQLMVFLFALAACVMLIPPRGAEGAALALLLTEGFLFVVTIATLAAGRRGPASGQAGMLRSAPL